jgi:hypothetical protein
MPTFRDQEYRLITLLPAGGEVENYSDVEVPDSTGDARFVVAEAQANRRVVIAWYLDVIYQYPPDEAIVCRAEGTLTKDAQASRRTALKGEEPGDWWTEGMGLQAWTLS